MTRRPRFRYGFSNFHMIRSVLLPCKSLEQLRSVFDKQTARKADNNPIKRAKLDHHTVILTSAEETLLGRGVALYGDDWARIRSQV